MSRAEPEQANPQRPVLRVEITVLFMKMVSALLHEMYRSIWFHDDLAHSTGFPVAERRGISWRENGREPSVLPQGEDGPGQRLVQLKDSSIHQSPRQPPSALLLSVLDSARCVMLATVILHQGVEGTTILILWT